MRNTMMTNSKYEPCTCDSPEPGPDDNPRRCPGCGGYHTGAIIGGEVHAGYTSLGNGQAFFEAKERWSLNSGSRGGINQNGGGEWFRSFASAEVVCPAGTESARRLGTDHVSFDHVVHGEGGVELIVANRRLADLPDGPTFPVETGDVDGP